MYSARYLKRNTVPAPKYYKNTFAILGDAAHASTPHQGAGAGQAIEDAYILSNLLGSIPTTTTSATSPLTIENAFRAYDAVRRPRTLRVVTTSRDAGLLYDFEDAEIGWDLERVGERLSQRYRWIWEVDLEAELERAKGIMGGGGEM